MEPVQPVIKQSNFLITLLSILLSISVFIAGFFAYQTQKLVKELTALQVTPTPTTFSKPQVLEISPLLVRNENLLKIPKVVPIGWIKLINQSFLLSYPNNWTCSSYNSSISCSENKNILIDGKDWDISINKRDDTFISVVNKTSTLVATELNIISSYKPEYRDVKLFENINGILIGNTHLIFEINNQVYSVYFSDISNLEQRKILSSFELTTDNQVACTMEAKICPDGSYVSRTGPKCEFTPCPTPTN